MVSLLVSNVSLFPDITEQSRNCKQETSRSFTASLQNSPIRQTKPSLCQSTHSVGHSVPSSGPCLEGRSVTLPTSFRPSMSLCFVSTRILCPAWLLLPFPQLAPRWLISCWRRFGVSSPLAFCGVSYSRIHQMLRLIHQRRPTNQNNSRQSPTDRYP